MTAGEVLVAVLTVAGVALTWWRREAWGNLNPVRGPERGVKAGGTDDAIHLKPRRWWPRTACGAWSFTRNTVAPAEVMPDPGEACWSCVEEWVY